MSHTVNHLPVLTWNALKLNAASLDLPGTAFSAPQLKINHLRTPVEYRSSAPAEEFRALLGSLGTSNREEAVVAGKFPIYAEQSFPTGMGADADRIFEEAAVPGAVLTFPAGAKPERHVSFRYTLPAGANSLARILIRVKAGAEAKVLLHASPELADPGPVFFGLQTFVVLEPGAKLDLYAVQMLAEGSSFFHDIGGWGEADSSFTLYKLDVGAAKVWEGLNHTQAGDGSRFSADLGYVGLPGSFTDINYNNVFRGRKAEGRMYFKGALMDGAEKTFRGTVDFRRASSGCAGDEQEDVILLGDDVVNKTIPLILGEEEDVEGRHASTIGSLSEDMLFYLETRGIDKRTAEELMVRASLAHIAEAVPSDDVRCRVNEAIGRIFRAEEEGSGE